MQWNGNVVIYRCLTILLIAGELHIATQTVDAQQKVQILSKENILQTDWTIAHRIALVCSACIVNFNTNFE